jgi:hypothetical protein
MKIKVLNAHISKQAGIFPFSVKFRITELEDDEIVKISQLSSIVINFDPRESGLTNFQFRPPTLGSLMKWTFKMKSDKDGLINFGELENIELMFALKEDADKYKEFILNQFSNEILRIKKLDVTEAKEEIYEIKSDEGIQKIYEGAKKLLDKDSVEYRQIVERNREAWKKLADL